MKNFTPEDKELLRHAVLECAVARHPTALPASGILRRVAGELDFRLTLEELESALVFLQGQGWLTFVYDEMGQTKYWTATAAGVLRVERGVSGMGPRTRE